MLEGILISLGLLFVPRYHAVAQYSEPLIVEQPPQATELSEVEHEPPTVVESTSEETTALTSENSVYNSCIKTARLLGVDLPRGDADQLEPNSPPTQGIAVLFRYPDGTAHVGVVLNLTEVGFYMSDGNYIKGKLRENVFVRWDNPDIYGFYNPDNDTTRTGE